MPNAWINFVHHYSQQHGISYSCALSDPSCRASYQESKLKYASKTQVSSKSKNKNVPTDEDMIKMAKMSPQQFLKFQQDHEAMYQNAMKTKRKTAAKNYVSEKFSGKGMMIRPKPTYVQGGMQNYMINEEDNDSSDDDSDGDY